MMSAAREGGASAQYLIGTFYETGTNLPANDQRAAVWFKRGAQNDFPHAKYELARLYMGGRGVPKDLVEANRLMDEAAQQGFQLAQRDYVLFLFKDAPAKLRDPIRAYGWLAVVQRYNPRQYRELAYIEETLTRSLSSSDLETAKQLQSTYPALYRPWNQR